MKLAEANSERALVIVGANADRFLGLGYDDEVRRAYAEEQKIKFPVGHWTDESDQAYGNIAIFPTLFLIDGQGMILNHWVGYVRREKLQEAISKLRTDIQSPNEGRIHPAP